MAGTIETGDGLLGNEDRPAQTPTPDTGVQSTRSNDDQLTEAELAYFKSGGQDVSGLLNDSRYKDDVIARQEAEAANQPAPTAAPASAPAPAQATTTPAPVTEETIPDNEEVDFSKVSEGADGRLRDDKGRFVPHAALHRERVRLQTERERNATLAQENSQLTTNYTKLAERVAVLQEIWNKPKDPEPAPAAPEPVAPPDPEQDIFAYTRWQAEQIKAAQNQILELSKKIEERDTNVTQRLTERDMIDGYKQDAVVFGQQQPAFREAYTNLINQRHAALALLGFNDAAERARIINTEEKELVQRAYGQGKRPAEFIYNYAVVNGYRPAAPAPNPTPAPAPAGAAPAAPTAAAPAPAPAPAPAAPAPVMSEAEKLLNAQRAQAATATLGGGGGSPTAEGLTAESLATMSEEQFVALAQKMGKVGMRQYLGGNV